MYNSSLRHGYCNHNASSVAVHSVNHPSRVPDRLWGSRDGAYKGSSGGFSEQKACLKTKYKEENDRPLILSVLVKSLPLPLGNSRRVVHVSPGRGIAN